MDAVPIDSIDVNNLEFREMAPEDADAVEIVEKACFAIPWSRESFWKEAQNENTLYLLALDGERVIGYVGCWISYEEAQADVWRDYRPGEGKGRNGHDLGGTADQCSGAGALQGLWFQGSWPPSEILSG